MGALLAIDPGTNSTGWAFWYQTKKKADLPELVGLCRGDMPDYGEAWWSRVDHRVRALESQIGYLLKPQVSVFCEMPIFFSGTAGGVVAAESSSLQKLCFLVGSIAEMVRRRGGVFHPVSVAEWKGQLPKVVVITRIQKKFTIRRTLSYSADIWDAVGIGLWAQGVRL